MKRKAPLDARDVHVFDFSGMYPSIILDQRELALLRLLFSQAPSQWFTPRALGGTSGSNHSYRLSKLAGRGWVERRQRETASPDARRGSYEYRLTAEGRRHVRSMKGTKFEEYALG